MRGLRSFAGLLAILIALGAYLYFVESKRSPDADVETKEKVFSVVPDTIDALSVRAESGDTTSLKKAGGEWQIVAPASAAADAAEVSGITSSLSTLEQQRLIDENPADLEEYGLAKPRIEVAFTSGGQEQKLLIGSKTPTGADLYAKTSGGPRVFLIASYLESTFNRKTFDLRDKTALKFERDGASSLEIATGGRTLTFSKAEGEWKMTQSPGARTDASAIEGLIARVANLQMESLAAADAVDLTQYGLEKPAASVRVSAGSATATLLLGSAAEEGQVFAKDVSRPAVFTVESSLLDELKKDAGEYRQKDLFEARAFNATRVEVDRGGAARVFEKTMAKNKDGQDEEKWRQTAPAAADVDAAQLDALLSALTGARAASFVETLPAGATPEAAFTVKFDEGRREERVRFLRAGGDAYAVRDGEPGAAKIEAATLDGILKALDDLT